MIDGCKGGHHLCVCAALLYELLYTQVFGLEEAELCQATEAFRAGGRRYRNSPSMCSDIDLGYDTPEDRGHRYTRSCCQVFHLRSVPKTDGPTYREEAEGGGASEDKQRAASDDTKVGGMMSPRRPSLFTSTMDAQRQKPAVVIGQPPAEAPPPARLSLPYKVMKSLDGEVYRNLEFDVWQDTCKGKDTPVLHHL